MSNLATTTSRLPGIIVTPTRDESRDAYLRDYQLRLPQASIARGTQPFIDASTHADTSVPLYAIAIKNGQNLTLDGISGSALEDEAERQGQPRRLPGAGGAGFAVATASSLGGTIFAGDVCTDKNGVRYQCTATKFYLAGDNVPLAGIDIGPSTNQLAGAILQWRTQRPGIGLTVTVFRQADGSGLTGGRNQETDPEIRQRLRDLRSASPASGNDAELQSLIQATPGLGIEKAFTYPCIKGPGTTGFVFTMRPAGPGASRIPNSTQIALALFNLGTLPVDYSIYAGTLIEVALSVVLQVSWSQGAAGWAELSPWPYFSSANPVSVVAGPTSATAIAFRLDCSGAPIAAGVGTQPPPQPGNVIGFYDRAGDDPNVGPVFRRKTLLTVTAAGGGLYDVTCDPTNNQSDTAYIPLIAQLCCPWSDSLNLLAPPTLSHFALLGPGEQKSASSFFDDGLRERRNPTSPAKWPSDLTHRVLNDLFDVAALNDVSVLSPAIPLACPAGVLGVSSNLLALRQLTAFAR